MKAAVLRGAKECVNLVASSVYDSKPVHYLSMVCNKIKWVVKEKVCGVFCLFIFYLKNILTTPQLHLFVPFLFSFILSSLKPVYNVDTHCTEVLRFLRLNQIDTYNNTMGHVDLAAQLRGTYRPDIWLRNRKWWWSIWFWALCVMLTNAYILYVKVNEEYGIEKTDLLSQHES